MKTILVVHAILSAVVFVHAFSYSTHLANKISKKYGITKKTKFRSYFSSPYLNMLILSFLPIVNIIFLLANMFISTNKTQEEDVINEIEKEI